MTTISEFSSQYYVIDPQVIPHGGEYVISNYDMFEGIRNFVGKPIVHVGGGHFDLHPQRAVLADTIAIPKSLTHLEDEPVLVPKYGAPVNTETM